MRRFIFILFIVMKIYSPAWTQDYQNYDSYVGIVANVETGIKTTEGITLPYMSLVLVEFPDKTFNVIETTVENNNGKTERGFPKIEKGWKVKLVCIKGTLLVQHIDSNDILIDTKTFTGIVEIIGTDLTTGDGEKKILFSLMKGERNIFAIPTENNQNAVNAIKDGVNIEITCKYSSSSSYFGKVYDVLSYKILQGSEMKGNEVKIQYQTLESVEKPSIAAEPVIKTENDDIPPTDSVVFDQPPTVIKQVKPIYPKFAAKAKAEGRVIALVWVDKKGQVRDAKILKSDSEILNQAAIDAAKQYVFTPATYKNEPVSVWIALHFSFNLR
jgi:TonB family protein